MLASALWCRTESAEPSAMLVLWTDTRGGGELRVTVDGRERGALAQFFAVAPPECAAGRGVLALPLPTGVHTVGARDALGRRWATSVRLRSGECRLIRLAPAGPHETATSVPAK